MSDAIGYRTVYLVEKKLTSTMNLLVKMKVTLLLPALLILSGMCLAKEVEKKPNVVIISVDTLRYDRLSSSGYKKNTSPNIDRLLARGARFSHARTVEPLTAPALISMLTSVYPHEHGASRNGLPIYPKLPSMSKTLKQQGYQTAAFVGNWTLKDRITGLAEHFGNYQEVLTRKRWLGLFLSEATAESLTDQAGDWLKSHSGDKPFFLWAHYADPHAPYRAHNRFADQLGLKPSDSLSKSDRYDMEIAFTDFHIGRFLKILSKHSRVEETLILFIADHGESLGEHEYWGHGRHLFEPTVRIPMGITWQGTITPQTVAAPASIIDVAPTLLGLLNFNKHTRFRGFDWTLVLAGISPANRERIIYLQAHKGAVQPIQGAQRGRQRGLLELAVVTGDFKECFRVRTKTRRIFNLQTDPLENRGTIKPKNTISQPLREWALDVEKGLRRIRDRQNNLREDDVEMLRSLGYVD